jgi:hypothetical protein
VAVYELDPLADPRWSEFIMRREDSTIFHTRDWLASLHHTYGYQPIAYTTSSGELDNGLVFCKIKSSLTGKRLVSLPFSDHCQPLADNDAANVIVQHLQSCSPLHKMKYIELRPLETDKLSCIASMTDTEHFCFQSIDLRKDISILYRAMHESCIRRKIKRAEKEQLVYEKGSSERLIRSFRYLFLLTRRRHRLPPPPASWFNNLAYFIGDRLTIHMVSQNDKPIASILTLAHKNTIVYKYGCSDSSFSNLGGTPYLFWKVIQQSKEIGLTEFDLGRSGYEDDGLIAFKEHLGATAKNITYFRGSSPKNERSFSKTGSASWMRYALSRLPDPLLTGVGNILYRHMG